MRRLVPVVGLLLLTRPGAAGETIGSRPTLRLVWVETGQVAPLIREVMAAEVERILEQMGVSLVWRSGGPQAVSEGDELRIVPLPSSGLGADAGRRVLGAVSQASARPKTVWIYYWNVIEAVGLRHDGLASSTPLQKRWVGLALGRVVAHEVVHSVAPDVPHARGGLMTSALRASLAAPVEVDAVSPGGLPPGRGPVGRRAGLHNPRRGRQALSPLAQARARRLR